MPANELFMGCNDHLKNFEIFLMTAVVSMSKAAQQTDAVQLSQLNAQPPERLNVQKAERLNN